MFKSELENHLRNQSLIKQQANARQQSLVEERNQRSTNGKREKELEGQAILAKLENQKQIIDTLLNQSRLSTLITTAQQMLQAKRKDEFDIDNGIRKDTQENQKITIYTTHPSYYTNEATVLNKTIELYWNDHDGSGDCIEVKMNPNGNIVFGNSLLLIPKAIWQSFPQVVETKLLDLIKNPDHYSPYKAPEMLHSSHNTPGMGDW
jgi:hypothetical protein